MFRHAGSRFAYVVHLRTFMAIWIMALPFALLSSCGWLTIPTVAMVGYALLGIESIGVEIENPCDATTSSHACAAQPLNSSTLSHRPVLGV